MSFTMKLSRGFRHVFITSNLLCSLWLALVLYICSTQFPHRFHLYTNGTFEHIHRSHMCSTRDAHRFHMWTIHTIHMFHTRLTHNSQGIHICSTRDPHMIHICSTHVPHLVHMSFTWIMYVCKMEAQLYTDFIQLIIHNTWVPRST